jgi:hypothetical protein
MFPSPSVSGDIELDAFCIPKEIYSDDDFDVIPTPFKNAVKFGAAQLAFYTSGRYAQAEVMGGMFEQRIGTGNVARNTGKTPNYYWKAF